MSKVVITDYAFNDLQIEKSVLEAEGLEVVGQKKYEGEDKLIELVKDADYVITQFAPINAKVISSMQKSKIIVRYGIGVDNVDLQAAADKSIPVCNVPDFCTDEVADHTLSMILALTRKIVPCWDIIRRDKNWTLPIPLDGMYVLREMTVGLVAYGKIARQVALRLKPFKCKILAFDPAIAPAVIVKDGCVPASLDEIITQSDIISLHCPSNDKTRYIINKHSISKMKKGAILVNASRGDLIKGDDLITALQSGRIGAAALDVTDPEPINMDNPLLKMGNVIINAHIASASASAVRNLRTSAANTVVARLKGAKLSNVVNGVNV